jgi:uncharacterized OB-fold protein
MTMPKPAPASDHQLPVLRGYAAEFYGWCQKHELRFQRCARCKTWRHPPRPLCFKCHSFEVEWAPVSGQGRLHAWTVPMAPIGSAFASQMPYVAAIVALDEGPRMASWVTGVAPEDLRVDMRLLVWFDAVTPEVTLAKFRPPD